ncbi:hypothetical protein ABN789_005000 [Salmonella enterica]
MKRFLLLSLVCCISSGMSASSLAVGNGNVPLNYNYNKPFSASSSPNNDLSGTCHTLDEPITLNIHFRNVDLNILNVVLSFEFSEPELPGFVPLNGGAYLAKGIPEVPLQYKILSGRDFFNPSSASWSRVLTLSSNISQFINRIDSGPLSRTIYMKSGVANNDSFVTLINRNLQAITIELNNRAGIAFPFPQDAVRHFVYKWNRRPRTNYMDLNTYRMATCLPDKTRTDKKNCIGNRYVLDFNPAYPYPTSDEADYSQSSAKFGNYGFLSAASQSGVDMQNYDTGLSYWISDTVKNSNTATQNLLQGTVIYDPVKKGRDIFKSFFFEDPQPNQWFKDDVAKALSNAISIIKYDGSLNLVNTDSLNLYILKKTDGKYAIALYGQPMMFPPKKTLAGAIIPSAQVREACQ